ncbi:hypothetical protein AAGS61_02920 [Lysinibacillus sp. KU-BSD001]|uniref:hypothetical protein n=1 Tax=Lysinibacillus sp. KU-BSD001 TaxID=3141328 RepID=UPI0036ED5735
MLEILNKRMVTTRKEHECYGCTGIIKKGEKSVYVRGKEDYQRVNFHLHPNCHVKVVKQKLFIEGFIKGAVKYDEKSLDDFSLDETDNENFSF